jgi:cation diffusion facilitator family transporter
MLTAQLQNKTTASFLTILSNCLLIAAKLWIAGISGSVSILSEAMHSGMDLLASLIAFFSIRLSVQPANESYPFGYGKIENLSALLEGLLLFAASLAIITEAMPKIIRPAEPSATYLMIGAMSTFAVISYVLSLYLTEVARREDSIALAADAVHLKTDAYASFGVAGGIALMNLTGFPVIDPIIAILVATLIGTEAYHLSRSALSQLLGAGIPMEERRKIKEVLERFRDNIIDYHEIKTRKAGCNTFINLHITIDKNLTVKESHTLEEFIEYQLGLAIKNANVNIHIDPS